MGSSEHVQYIRGYHYECGGIPCVHWGMFSTLGDVQYIGEIPLEHWGGGRGNIMSTLGDVQHIRGIS